MQDCDEVVSVGAVALLSVLDPSEAIKAHQRWRVPSRSHNLLSVGRRPGEDGDEAGEHLAEATVLAAIERAGVPLTLLDLADELGMEQTKTTLLQISGALQALMMAGRVVRCGQPSGPTLYGLAGRDDPQPDPEIAARAAIARPPALQGADLEGSVTLRVLRWLSGPHPSGARSTEIAAATGSTIRSVETATLRLHRDGLLTMACRAPREWIMTAQQKRAAAVELARAAKAG